MSKPTIIFVPGCWHVPTHFDHVRKHLESSGYTCAGVDLPGNTGAPNITIQDDIAAIRSAVLFHLNSGQNVVLVTHSYSSIPGTAALQDFSTSARNGAGHSTSVIAAIIISGFLLPPESTMLGVSGGSLAPQYLISEDGASTLPFAGPGAIHILYNDLETNEALRAVWKLKPQSYTINTSPVPDQVAGLKGIPLHYLLCDNDNAVPWEWQVATVKGFKDAGIEVKAEVARSGHSPFLKCPEEVAKFVRKAAGEEVETGMAALPENGSKP